MIDEIIVSTIYNDTVVKKGDLVGACKAIPLFIKKEKLELAKKINKKVIGIKQFYKKQTAIITTGNEVFYNRIKDGFRDVLFNKLSLYDCDIFYHKIVQDDLLKIQNEIINAYNKGAQLILLTGGMSVDPDDLTPIAIKNVADFTVSYGSPILPGAMFLVAYYKNIPILGLPGSVIFSKKTAFDVILPKILANEIISKEIIASFGEGGFLSGLKN